VDPLSTTYGTPSRTTTTPTWSQRQVPIELRPYTHGSGGGGGEAGCGDECAGRVARTGVLPLGFAPARIRSPVSRSTPLGSTAGGAKKASQQRTVAASEAARQEFMNVEGVAAAKQPGL